MLGKIHPLLISAVVLVIVPLIILPTDGTGCQTFLCGSGESIQAHFECNGYKNCSDGSDENCDSCVAKHGGTCCGEKYIPPYWYCDGWVDCTDMSDENNCYCKCEMKCPEPDEPKCYPGWYKCDYYADCSDGSDEDNCTCDTTSGELHKCNNGHCIYSEWVCDGWYDCIDDSDEENCTAGNKALSQGIVEQALAPGPKTDLRKTRRKGGSSKGQSHVGSKKLTKNRLW